ncbi:MAG: hypothetical protein GXP55_11785 [Deltaproteobacteria bacterium]|nr:hypothetical protein [Deltaproteobacteria bacterium]
MSALGGLARDWAVSVDLAPANQAPSAESATSALLYRVVSQSLGAATRALGFEGAREGASVLILESQAQAYCVDGVPQRRPACNGRRLLSALARARLDRPGEFVPSPELIAATWPGEELLGRSGSNRLHVELSKLRSAGLRAHLEREGASYRLSPELTLRVVPAHALDVDGQG